MAFFTNYEKLIQKGLELVEQKEYPKAYEIFKSIPESKRTETVYFHMGAILINGLNIEDTLERQLFGKFKYREEAEQYLVKAINLGNEDAKYILGLAYGDGRMTDYDKKNFKHVYEMTIKYLTPFAEDGVLAAIVNLGLAYLYGYDEENDLNKFNFNIPNPGRDFEKAFRYLSIAADNGVRKIYRYLAEMYEYGRGTNRNLDKARYYYEKAFREFGDPEAMKKLNQWRY